MERYNRDKLIVDNQRLVYHTYEQLSKTNLVLKNKADIISEGMIGLVKAADSFDATKGCKFSTFAASCIRNAMFMYIRRVSKYWRKEVSIYNPIGTDVDGSELCFADVLCDEDTDYEEESLRNDLKAKVENLPESDRELMQAVLTGYKQKEIAAMLGVEQPTISRRIKAIKHKMKKQLSSLCDR